MPRTTLRPPAPGFPHLPLDVLRRARVVMFRLLQYRQQRLLVSTVVEAVTNWRAVSVSVPRTRRHGAEDVNSQAAIAMQAVNMLGGVHWLPRPMPHISRTSDWMRSCKPRRV